MSKELRSIDLSRGPADGMKQLLVEESEIERLMAKYDCTADLARQPVWELPKKFRFPRYDGSFTLIDLGPVMALSLPYLDLVHNVTAILVNTLRANTELECAWVSIGVKLPEKITVAPRHYHSLHFRQVDAERLRTSLTRHIKNVYKIRTRYVEREKQTRRKTPRRNTRKPIEPT